MNEMTKSNAHDEEGEELDADAILAELEAEEDEDISSLREQKLSEINSGSAKATISIRQDSYVTLKSDEDTLRWTTEHHNALVHFFHPDFARCSIMDEHLTAIAHKHSELRNESSEDATQFARVDVGHAEFVVQKLGVRILPCVIGFINGQVVGRIVGFEGVIWGGRETGLPTTKAIEERFVDWALLKRSLIQLEDDDESEDEEASLNQTGRRGISGRKHEVIDEDDDWD